MKVPDDHPVKKLDKPDSDYSPQKVLEVQMNAFSSETSHEIEDGAIKTAYNFASPQNRASTGPLSRFTRMVKNEQYSALIDHSGFKVLDKEITDEDAKFHVEVLSKEANYVEYVFRISKQSGGRWKNYWLTDSVIQMS